MARIEIAVVSDWLRVCVRPGRETRGGVGKNAMIEGYGNLDISHGCLPWTVLVRQHSVRELVRHLQDGPTTRAHVFYRLLINAQVRKMKRSTFQSG